MPDDRPDHPQQIEAIVRASERFRAAIERCNPAALPITTQSFPEGACGDAVTLLGHYLKDEGFGRSYYWSGWRVEGERRFSHAWLQFGGMVVDITADQFPDVEERLIVCRGARRGRAHPFEHSVRRW